MFTNIKNISMGKFLAKETPKRQFQSVVSFPEDSYEFTTKKTNQEIINSERYLFLTEDVSSQQEKKDFDFTRKLKSKEAIFAIEHDFDDKQVQAYIDLKDNYLLPVESYSPEMVVRKVNRYSLLVSEDKDSEGNLLSGLSRPLKVNEALAFMKAKYDDKQIQSFIELKESGLDIRTIQELVEDYQEYKDCNSFLDLTPQQRKNLIRKLTSRKGLLKYFPEIKNGFSILPKTNEEYCSTLSLLSKLVGVQTKELNKNQKENFARGINEIVSNVKYENLKELDMYLEYSTKDFVANISEQIDNLTESEKSYVTDIFGFEIKDGKLKGYPTVLVENFKDIKSQKIKSTVDNIKPFVEKYSERNKIIIPKNENLEKVLNNILEGLPELRTIIGREQTQIYKNTLGLYSLKVIQNVAKSPEYRTLSDSDKKVLIISALLEDITKKEGQIDRVHASQSAFDAYYITKKLDLTEEEQIKIYSLIKSHEWFDEISLADRWEQNDVLKNVVFGLRYSNVFELSKILCEANIKSIGEGNEYWNKYKYDFTCMQEEITSRISELRKSQIFLPQTKIPKASELKNVQMRMSDGIINTVLTIDEMEEDLSKYGFENGVTKDNLRLLVHAFLEDGSLQIVDTFSLIDSDAVLSASYINPQNSQAFREFGVGIEVHTSDVHIGYYEDFGSNYKKNTTMLAKDFLFADGLYGNVERSYISDLIKNKLNITSEEYVELIKKVEGCKSIFDVENIDKEFASALLDIIDLIEDDRGRENSYNEFLISHPKINAIYVYNKNFKDIPLYLRKYAENNDLPILIFGSGN